MTCTQNKNQIVQFKVFYPFIIPYAANLFSLKNVIINKKLFITVPSHQILFIKLKNNLWWSWEVISVLLMTTNIKMDFNLLLPFSLQFKKMLLVKFTVNKLQGRLNHVYNLRPCSYLGNLCDRNAFIIFFPRPIFILEKCHAKIQAIWSVYCQEKSSVDCWFTCTSFFTSISNFHYTLFKRAESAFPSPKKPKQKTKNSPPMIILNLSMFKRAKDYGALNTCFTFSVATTSNIDFLFCLQGNFVSWTFQHYLNHNLINRMSAELGSISRTCSDCFC